MKFRNIAHTVYTIHTRLKELWGKRNRLHAAWWGVKLGKGSGFIGKCYFKRYPGTTIIIGNNCSFLSSSNANLIGINKPCIISTHQSGHKAIIEIGNNCGFSGTIIGAFRQIRLGNNVRCGANTLITDADWHLDDPRSGPPKEVVIEDNVWLGVNTVVLKGVTIGANTVIGANSVVTKSIPANVIAAGNPCQVIRVLNDKEIPTLQAMYQI
ncbi:acyltransferase [Paraflavitalea speifideaquila]|uniref:acyltransferase n=1 Tax=Paraflavitalea speifideaquila TaxID=3076558 RepID=UPI0028E4B916|nr:DapH/DapD/GlmU-related protein [Paraflavitalea speifideiaquila]